MGGLAALTGLLGLLVAIIFVIIVVVLSRYKRCPSDKILVVYGKIGKGRDGSERSSKCIHGGAAFIMPVLQNYQFLDLTPMSIEVNLNKALSKQNIRVDVPSRFTVAISTEPAVMANAAERILGLSLKAIQEMAKDIIIGQMRLIVATMDIEELNTDRDKFLESVSKNVETELKKIGLKLINVNVTDIEDESGYIIALGKEAAAKAINDAKKMVAERERDGEVGKAEAERERDIKIAQAKKDREIGMALALRDEEIGKAEATRDEEIGKAEAVREQRIKMSEANAKAVEGENLAKIDIANSEALRREKEAEAQRKAIAAEKVQTAKALEESYTAEKEAEISRAEREKATQRADIIIPAQIEKEKVEIDAEAEAEKIRRHAKGEADAMYFKMEAEARGIFEILSKQAEGFERLVAAGGSDPKNAVLLMIADKLPELVRTQVDAIKNIKIDKVTVWDSNGNAGEGGKTATANFLSGIAKSIPPLEDLFGMAGMDLPDYLGKRKGETPAITSGTSTVDTKINPADELKGKADLFKSSKGNPAK